ncbi:MAG: hypothetical protein LBR12_00320 [Opitutaceae bacterium]|jgi:glycerophosphoryl diester phosphodiesterase|nr:hypothetical protein [Opitutaceae bacterium]
MRKKLPRLLSAALGALCAATTAAAATPPPAFPLPLAHRGGSREADENTLAAFQTAFAAGARAFETDVRMSLDGALFLLHDNTLKRTTGADGSVETLTAAQLREIRTLKTKAPIPALDDLLAFLAEKTAAKENVLLQLELKTNKKQYPDDALDPYCRKIHAAVSGKLPPSAYRYSSFDRRALLAMRRAAPNATLVILGDPCGPDRVREALDLGIHTIACRVKGTTREAVDAARRAGLSVGGWGAPTPADYQKAAAAGLEFVTTDTPAAVLAWLKTQKQPAP